MKIPFLPLKKLNQSCQSDINSGITRVVDSGWYILGQEVCSFEQEFASLLGLKYTTAAVSSGTDAISLSLMALGITCGDEVITVANTAFPTIASIYKVGGRVKLVDIRPTTRCLDPQLLKEAITPETKAVVYVHLYGWPTHDFFEIKKTCEEKGVKLIEDCAQCTLATLDGDCIGTLGDASAFSFYPSKNLGALGDAGLVVSRHQEVIERVKELRNYGYQEGVSHHWGWNSRMDDVQAAILRAKLSHLKSWNQRRLELAQNYNEALSALDLILPTHEKNVDPSIHLYVIQTQRRDKLQKYLLDRGIETMIHYRDPVHHHPVFQEKISLPVSERLSQQILSLPLHQELTNDEQLSVVESIKDFYKRF